MHGERFLGDVSKLLSGSFTLRDVAKSLGVRMGGSSLLSCPLWRNED